MYPTYPDRVKGLLNLNQITAQSSGLKKRLTSASKKRRYDLLEVEQMRDKWRKRHKKLMKKINKTKATL